MIRSLISILVVGAVVNGCAQNGLNDKNLSSDDAFKVLKGVPMEAGTPNSDGEYSDVSAEQFLALVEDVMDAQNAKGVRGAVNSETADAGLEGMASVFEMLQNDDVNDTRGLARAAVLRSGFGSFLSSIMGILQLVAPVISAIAPQFAPIIQALLVIIPSISQLFGGSFGVTDLEARVNTPALDSNLVCVQYGLNFSRLHFSA